MWFRSVNGLKGMKRSNTPETGLRASESKTNGIRTQKNGRITYTHRRVLVELRKIEAILRKDVYDRLAAELQDVLLQGWNARQKDAIENVIRAIKGRGPVAQREMFSQAQLDEMIGALRVTLGDRFAADVAPALKEIELQTYATGLTGKVQVKPTFNLVDQKAIAFLEQHNIYWVKNFFDRQLADRVTDLGSRVLNEGMNRQQAGELFEQAFADQYEAYSWRYWQGFANHVVTRSREFGAVERYVRAGRDYLQVKAILDHRTTEICRHMHDKVFKVADAVKLRNDMINAKNPEEVISIAPWMKPDALVAKPSKALPVHMTLPPYHFNCRSRTVTATEKDVQEQLRYEKRVQDLHSHKEYKKQYAAYRELGEDAPVHRSLRFDENVVRWIAQQGEAPDFDTRMTRYKKAFKALLDQANEKAG